MVRRFGRSRREARHRVVVGQRNRAEAQPAGGADDFDGTVVSDSIRQNRDTLIQLQLSEGGAEARFWTSDLTAEYVRLNADYHT